MRKMNSKHRKMISAMRLPRCQGQIEAASLGIEGALVR